MPKYVEMIGKSFGRLTVISRAENDKNGTARWLCRCECGNEITTWGTCLRNGNTKSCGCLNDEVRHKSKKITARKNERLYTIWKNLRQRCTNPNSISYKNYGARGITVCEEWNDYIVFKKWAFSNGYNDSLSIDRKDVNGNYCPENCKWSDDEEQANNKRNNVKYFVNGEYLTLPQVAKKYNISFGALRTRLQNGWNIENAISIPVRKHKKYINASKEVI